jgi:hypothetical protein
MAIAFVDLVAVKREVYQDPAEGGVFLRPPEHTGSFTECFANIKNILAACTACILDRYFLQYYVMRYHLSLLHCVA